MRAFNGCTVRQTGPDSFTIAADAKTDFFIDGLTGYRLENAPYYYDDTEGDFIITARISPDFKETYDAGAILVMDGPGRWIKAAFELTDLGHPSIVTVATGGVSDDCNGELIAARAIHVRVARRKDCWAVHYSLEGSVWKMVRYFSFRMGARVKAGVSAQSPAGEGCAVEFTGLRAAPNGLKDLRKGV